jgi:hypothetical protein
MLVILINVIIFKINNNNNNNNKPINTVYGDIKTVVSYAAATGYRFRYDSAETISKRYNNLTHNAFLNRFWYVFETF